jgi:putative transposase
MKINRGYRVELDLNNKQKTLCMKACGAARWAYNWGLQRKKEEYEKTGKSPSAYTLQSELVKLKKTTVPWLNEVTKWAPGEALRRLDKAFDGFFRRCKLNKHGKLKGKVGYPRFKSRKNGIGSFSVFDCIHVTDKTIYITRVGDLRLKERGYLPTSGVRITSATISEKAGRWFVTVKTEQDIPDPKPSTNPVVGVDLGLKTFATLSDGTTIQSPKALKKNLKKLRSLSRSVSRKQKGSNNRKKAVKRLAKLNMRIANIRNDHLHKVTTMLTKTKSAIGIEDLGVSGMVKNRRLARAINDAGWGEFRRQLEYKGKWYGCEIKVADRFFASSKIHRTCGWKNEDLKLSDRTWICGGCGAVVDRDKNASENLEDVAKGITTVGYTGSKACGLSVSPSSMKAVQDEAGTMQLSQGV